MSFTWLEDVGLIWAVSLVTIVYLALLVWCLARPGAQIMEGAPDRRRWRDLRLWIAPLLLVQIALYWLFR